MITLTFADTCKSKSSSSLPPLSVCPGEMAELKADLQSDKKERKKEAIKKIIANMTVGKDVRSVT